ncbi:MAG TPA: spermidine/putrescine ABC transporter substrate-binding protein [Candidatus Limnocylindrales bacterium]|nr:spermidine/putrescine ABC transporter substrate-binding protein [Candidatus Limnocylindrales bacterium]
MNRRMFLLGMAALAGCARDRRPRLNVYNWSTYVAPDTISSFEDEFGVRVRYATYESNEEMLAKVLSGNSGWDVVFPTYNRVQPMREYGLLQPLRHEWLPGLSNLDPRFRSPAWDPGLQWAMPYMWFSTGIIYNRELQPALTRWADLWNPRLKNRLTMLDDPEDMLGACLKKLGLPFSSTDPGELRRAEQEALAQKPLLRAYLNAEVRDQLVSGDVLAAQLWSTTAQQAIDAAPNLAFAYPAEGFPFYCDCAVVLRESSRSRLAHQFLDYLLRPKVSAAIAGYTRTATANGAAHALLPPETRNNPTLYPPEDIFRRGEWPRTLPPAAQRLRDRIWTEIKSA